MVSALLQDEIRMNKKINKSKLNNNYVDLEINNGIYTVTFRRPDKMNALRSIDFEHLILILKQFNTDDSAFVLILTGTGKAFCSGEDLNELLNDGELLSENVTNRVSVLQSISDLIYQSNKPIIAAVNGAAVGFGMEVTLACDIRIASKSAYFWMPEAIRGLVPTNGSFYLLPRLIGGSNASNMMLLSAKISANTAKNIGLISEIYDDENILTEAKALADKLVDHSSQSIFHIKRLMRKSNSDSWKNMLVEETAAVISLAESGEIGLGAENFSKRKRS